MLTVMTTEFTTDIVEIWQAYCFMLNAERGRPLNLSSVNIPMCRVRVNSQHLPLSPKQAPVEFETRGMEWPCVKKMFQSRDLVMDVVDEGRDRLNVFIRDRTLEVAVRLAFSDPLPYGLYLCR